MFSTLHVVATCEGHLDNSIVPTLFPYNNILELFWVLLCVNFLTVFYIMVYYSNLIEYYRYITDVIVMM